MKANFSKVASLAIGVAILCLIAGYAILAWNEPGGSPPNSNVAAPINTGNDSQTKNGGFNILGSMGVGTVSPAQKLDVAGNINGTGLCINNSCCTDWASCVALGGGGGCKAAGDACANASDCCSSLCTGGICTNPPSCSANGIGCTSSSECCSASCKDNKCVGGSGCNDSMASCTDNADCCSGVCFGGTCGIYYPCSGESLPSGAKKIFVTSATFNANDVPNETTADTKCNQVASAVGYNGNFKAMTYMGNRNINQVIVSGQSFWNGQKSGTACAWKMVASNMADFFTDKGGGNYLREPILYNEQGVSMSGVGVWTGFKAIGSGNYELLNHDSWTCHSWHPGTVCVNTWKGGCQYRGLAGPPYSSCSYYKESSHWYGLTQHKGIQWSYNSWCSENDTYSNAVWDNCFNNLRALYCIEQ